MRVNYDQINFVNKQNNSSFHELLNYSLYTSTNCHLINFISKLLFKYWLCNFHDEPSRRYYI